MVFRAGLSDFPMEMGAVPAEVTWQDRSKPKFWGWGSCHDWVGEGWDRTAASELLGFVPLATVTRSPAYGQGRAGGPAIGACREGEVCGYPEASACTGRPVLPAQVVSQTESRSCQTLRRVKPGRTNCAILEPG